MTRASDLASPLTRYTLACERSAARVIDTYSTSFGTATRLLGTRHRAHVRNIYGLVRIADELVDGVTVEAGYAPDAQHQELDRLEADTLTAISRGYSSNPVVHAFAHTARAAGIDAALVAPFFTSMRSDLPAPQSEHGPTEDGPRHLASEFNQAAHASYVYGSAEVVGLMCLRVFLRDDILSEERRATLERGACRLGAAFQNVNFLRDLADDTDRLGRHYLSTTVDLTPAQHKRWVETIRAQLTEAEETLPLLPGDARLAVTSALRLFRSLNERLARTPTEHLTRRRARVPGLTKAWLVARAAVDTRRSTLA
ncbi:Phytoene synthase [Leucobacter sp. 7(1)]|uniref:phytoene/squalene synthase family protein n=1 Tax=Leucobacter sp. 7(1) TaxID=1255613 RepID=UPI00097F481E|nr:squalene/phytoene synthase family protein [Leucobacter sp. 7(1)]SJN09996.1 Phytoene synthase [Leucobacter sp. 7(1)]